MQPGSAKLQHESLQGHLLGGNTSQHAQQDSAPAGQGLLTAKLLRVLSAEHMHIYTEDIALSRKIKRLPKQHSVQEPPVRSRKRRASQITAEQAEMSSNHSLEHETASEEAGSHSRQPFSRPNPAEHQEHKAQRTKRKRARRSDDDDPAWQPEEAIADQADSPAKAIKNYRQSTATPSAKHSAAHDTAAGHIPKSQYKGVSCHK